MKFTKMHGIGNDYVFVNCFEESVDNPAEISRRVSDRHFGIGSDGLILICPSSKADAEMRIFNSDGSESENCGNGIRCVSKYIYDHGIVNNKSVSIETLAGIKKVELTVENGKASQAKVNMGNPILERGRIPVTGGDKNATVIDEPLIVDGTEYRITCVSMGNPHCVIFMDNVKELPLEKIGPLFERHELFPERINAHFVKIHDRAKVEMRTWERGSGITLACGTGASAVCAAGTLNGKTDRSILAALPGGDLKLEWIENGPIFMTGPATEAFNGEWTADL